jgi:hypothetical protein
MKKTMSVRACASLIITSVVVFAFLAGCAASPKRPSDDRGVVFQQPLSNARAAAESALVVHGFDIKKREELYLQGFRPRKVGLVVGSGGETVGVWLEAIEEHRTRVLVTTDRTFVGGAGQKNWDDEILEEIRRGLGNEDR